MISNTNTWTLDNLVKKIESDPYFVRSLSGPELDWLLSVFDIEASNCCGVIDDLLGDVAADEAETVDGTKAASEEVTQALEELNAPHLLMDEELDANLATLQIDTASVSEMIEKELVEPRKPPTPGWILPVRPSASEASSLLGFNRPSLFGFYRFWEEAHVRPRTIMSGMDCVVAEDGLLYAVVGVGRGYATPSAIAHRSILGRARVYELHSDRVIACNDPVVGYGKAAAARLNFCTGNTCTGQLLERVELPPTFTMEAPATLAVGLIASVVLGEAAKNYKDAFNQYMREELTAVQSRKAVHTLRKWLAHECGIGERVLFLRALMETVTQGVVELGNLGSPVERHRGGPSAAMLCGWLRTLTQRLAFPTNDQGCLDRYPLDLVEADFVASPVIELGRTRGSVVSHRGGLFERTAILEIGSDPGRSEAVVTELC
jgi:hypothetical protein